MNMPRDRFFVDPATPSANVPRGPVWPVGDTVNIIAWARSEAAAETICAALNGRRYRSAMPPKRATDIDPVLLAQLVEALDNALAHHGDKMPKEDRVRRQALVIAGRKAYRKALPEDPEIMRHSADLTPEMNQGGV